MSTELRQLATMAVDHAVSAHHAADARPGETTAEAHALTAIALACAFLLESERLREAEEAADAARRHGLCYDHQDDLRQGPRGSCVVVDCDGRARR